VSLHTRHAFSVFIFCVAYATSAPSCVVLGFAVRVRTADERSAWTDASFLDASQCVGTVLVGLTFGLGRPRFQDAATFVGISGHASRTYAFVTSFLVETLSAVGARSICALVHIDATLQGVSFVTGFAHALRRIARSAFRVDSAGEPLARTLAFVVVLGVSEERRWTDAFARLDASLVRRTLVIVDAAFLCR
jgi:hypothetical protein